MTSDVWLFFAVFCFLLEAVIGLLSFSSRPFPYGGVLLPLGLAFLAISFLSMVARA